MSTISNGDDAVLAVPGQRLGGRVALVTGASSGIGRATARALAAAGARVGVAARREERLDELAGEIADAGGEALALPADVTDAVQAEAMVRRAEEAFGRVDILVNSAGIMLPAPVHEADPDDWRRMVDVNLLGALYATRAVLPAMLARGDGHIVSVSSTSGRKHQQRFAVYAATKHGLGAFHEVLRKEVHPKRVRVTLFEPGPTATELADHVDREQMQQLAAEFEGQEFLQAEDVAQGILWTLAQPARVNVSEVLFRPTDQKDW